MNIFYIFIDDSGKLYDENKFSNYTATVFSNDSDYYKFGKEFTNNLIKINGGKEIKGSKFWSRSAPININKILNLLNTNSIKTFSLMINSKTLNNKYKNDIQTERILNICIAILCQYIIDELNLSDCQLNLYIDEQIRITYKKENNKSLKNFLNYKSKNGIYTIFSQQKFREKNITFGVKDNCNSKLYSGIMISDLLANGMNRIYNKNDNEVKEYLKKNNIVVNLKIWPKN